MGFEVASPTLVNLPLRGVLRHPHGCLIGSSRHPPGNRSPHCECAPEGRTMGWLGLIISIIIIGLIAGAVARLVIPGKQDMSIGMTILLGIVGSFVGGFLGFLIFRADPNGGFLQPSGIIGSIIGSIIVLLIWVAVKRRNGTARRV